MVLVWVWPWALVLALWQFHRLWMRSLRFCTPWAWVVCHRLLLRSLRPQLLRCRQAWLAWSPGRSLFLQALLLHWLLLVMVQRQFLL